MQSPPGPETVIDGVRYLYFGGTSYLGLAGHPEVIEAGCVALRQFGVHTATSRARFGTSPPVQEVEERAAAFFGAEDAFYFGSGYNSNHILLAALAPEADLVLVDEAAHYSVLEAARLARVPVVPFRHRDAADLARRAEPGQRLLIMADAVGPSTGEIVPLLDYLRALDHAGAATFLLDDAHGFGVLGERGRGVLDEFGLWSKANHSAGPAGLRLCVGGTLSKALGGFGGIIPGSREFVAQLRKASHYFDAASAPAAPVAASSSKALEIVLREPALRQRLRENTLHLRAGLRKLGVTVPDGASANCGVSLGEAANMRRIHEALKGRGIMLPYLAAYSGLPAEGVLRFAVFANHTTAQIDHLLNELAALL